MKAIIRVAAQVNTGLDGLRTAEFVAEQIVIQANKWLGVTEAWVEEVRAATPEEAARG